MTEVSFTSIDDIHAALDADSGREILTSARALADKYGPRLDVLVVAGRLGSPTRLWLLKRAENP